jgi:Sporulation and spore germination
VQPFRWLILITLLAGIACCSQGTPSKVADDVKISTRVERVRVFLIDPQKGGAAGRCDDKAVPVEVDLPIETPALEGALEGLFSLGRAPYDPRSGYYNALHASPLTLARIERRGPEAVVQLNGYLELDDPCDGARALAQLQETVLQFKEIRHAQFYLEGKPLQDGLAGR